MFYVASSSEPPKQRKAGNKLSFLTAGWKEL